HSFRVQLGAYGHLYINVILPLLRALAPISLPMVVAIARGVSVAAAAAVLLGTFAWARRLYGSLAAWIALLLVALNQTIYTWAGIVHPDMLQSVLLLAALYYTARCFDEPKTKVIFTASVFAGLAFATKYSGLFVLPLIALAALGRASTGAGRGAE